MKPCTFHYHRPATLDDALSLLARHGDDAKPLAGGQSLVPMMNLRLAQPGQLIDMQAVNGLDFVRESGPVLEIGPMVRHQTLADSALVQRACPLLAEAAATIGHYAIRQRGTIGGSLAHADPAAQLPLVAVALDAEFELASLRGHRRLPASEFFQSVMTTSLAPDELIVALRFPVTAPQEGVAFRHFSRRHGDFAIVSVAATVRLDGARIARLRLAIGGVASAPLTLHALADAQAGQVPDATWVARVAAAARKAVDVADDARISHDYRRELIDVLVQRALTAALSRIGVNV